jgi:hypothetical protein
MRARTTMADMAVVYRRPAGVMRQSVKPQLASWDRAAHPSQVKLARFLGTWTPSPGRYRRRCAAGLPPS